MSGLCDTTPPMIKDKKKKQLGMDPGTASYRLKMDLLFRFIECLAFKCFRCEGALSREDFSVDHKKPWLDSEDPVGLFFDLSNVSFSHKKCNYEHSRGRKKYLTPEDSLLARADRKRKWRKNNPEKYKKQRRKKYLRTGT